MKITWGHTPWWYFEVIIILPQYILYVHEAVIKAKKHKSLKYSCWLLKTINLKRHSKRIISHLGVR